MSLLTELRNVDPRDPGHWSTRISVLTACAVFALVTALGMQVRVRGQTLPQLASAGRGLQESLEKLEAARQAKDQAGLLRSELDRQSQRLQRVATWIPARPETLNLAVALTDAPNDSPIREVRPWHPAGALSRPLPYVGGEIEVSANYGEIIQFLDFALAQGPLREMEEIIIFTDSETDRLRATVRMLAYYGNERYAAIPRSGAAEVPGPSPPGPLRADLPSPFGPAPKNIEGPDPGQVPGKAEPRRQAGTIRVGRTRYELVEDSVGNIRLEPLSP